MSDKGYWERHARNYDASLRWVLGRPLPRMLQLAREAVRGKKKILEVAAGTGIVTAAIARTSDSIIATDYAAAMVEVLEQRVRGAGLENVTCEQADIYALPYAEGEFDAVVAANVLHLVPDLPEALSAIRKVAAPDAILVAPTFCHDQTRFSWLVSRLLALSGFPGHRRFSAHSLRDAFEENGLRIAKFELLPGLIPVGFVVACFESPAHM
ncbi:MAG TPA: class I SAM-dependent methyltransferase [Woeseiaceae bacterium]|nr:class I SAM-dependent methyltransferase [Woeseiaceae bacterium]|tara:strand:+ start:1253 stop:1885 length:633 start_codon:yes stop_codon:yes gene_type:complete